MTFHYRSFTYQIDQNNKASMKINGVEITFKPRATQYLAVDAVHKFIDNHIEGNIRFG